MRRAKIVNSGHSHLKENRANGVRPPARGGEEKDWLLRSERGRRIDTPPASLLTKSHRERRIENTLTGKCFQCKTPRWITETLRRSQSSGPSHSASRLRRKCARPARRRSTPWSGWWPTTRSSIPRAFAASTATPSSAWETLLPCKASSTASLTSSSCSRAKATTTRASDASSTKSAGPPRRQKTSPRRRENKKRPPSLNLFPFFVFPPSKLAITHTTVLFFNFIPS